MNILARARFGMMETLRGTNSLHYLERYQESQWWPRERLREWQDSRLRDLIRHAVERVPYYRDYFHKNGLKPEDIRGQGDLHKLPIVDKIVIGRNYQSFLADNHAEFRSRPARTAGTTGTPFAYLLDRDAWSVGWACNWRGWGWGGYRVGDRIAILAGSSLFRGSMDRGFKKARSWLYYSVLQNAVPLSAFDMSPARLSQYVRTLKRANPQYLRCYAQAGYIFAAYCRENDVRDLSFRAIFSTAEQLLPSQRKVIEQQFRCPVYDDYGCYDGNLKAMECEEHDGYHIAMEAAIVEFVENGVAVKENESGELLATSLHNYSMPFIRYRVGDRGVPSARACRCGRGLALMERVEGRCNDCIRTPEGKIIHSEFISHIFWETTWVDQFQVRQDRLSEIEILIVKNRAPRPGEMEKLRSALSQELGQLAIRVSFVDAIEATAAGKRRFIVSALT